MAAPSSPTATLNQVCSFSSNLLINQPSEKQTLAFIQSVDDWSDLVRRSEEHGLTPALWHIIKPYHEHIPLENTRTLKILQLRQQLNFVAQHQALLEVRKIFDDCHINMVLLKGSALRYCLYDPPSDRMMFDLDILIDPKQAEMAADCLRQIGYKIASEPHQVEHHHLPAATKTINDFDIVIELHTEALSKDMQTLISFDSHLPFRQIVFENKQWHVLSHIDTLTHLCLHTFTRDAIIKLSGIVDIMRYVSRYYGEIDWEQIRRHHGFIINTITLIDCIVERNPKLANLSTALSDKEKQKMKGIGHGMAPLREALNKEKSLLSRFYAVFIPPKWWTHIFYNIPANRSLLLVRLWHHPIKALRWIVSKEGQVLKARVKRK